MGTVQRERVVSPTHPTVDGRDDRGPRGKDSPRGSLVSGREGRIRMGRGRDPRGTWGKGDWDGGLPFVLSTSGDVSGSIFVRGVLFRGG